MSDIKYEVGDSTDVPAEDMSQEVDLDKDYHEDWESKMTRVFIQLNVLFGSMTARLMVMICNETMMRPWVGAAEDELWCSPNIKKFMSILGLKPNRKKDSIKYYNAIDKLNESGFVAKQIVNTISGGTQLMLAVNYERVDELLTLPRYTTSVPAVLLQDEKYQKIIKEMRDATPAK